MPRKQPDNKVLEFTQKEASTTFDYYMSHFQSFNSKAINSIQLNLAIIGVLLTISSILVSGGKNKIILQFTKNVSPTGIIGLFALLLSFMSALSIVQPVTYAGLGSGDLRRIYEGDFDRENLINELVLSYRNWLERNEKESKKLRARLTLSYYLTVIFVLSIVFVYISSFSSIGLSVLENKYIQSGILLLFIVESYTSQYLPNISIIVSLKNLASYFSFRINKKLSDIHYEYTSPVNYQSSNWMSHSDRRILEFLNEYNGYLLPSTIAFNINLYSQEVRGRLPILRLYGLVLGSRKGKWKISELGAEFINGETKMDELEQLKRQQASWMRSIDDSILELLEETQLSLSPTNIRKNIGSDWTTVKGRLEILERYGVVTKNSGEYKITQNGEDYLSGSISASSLIPEN